MLIPSTRHALRTRKYMSTMYILVPFHQSLPRLYRKGTGGMVLSLSHKSPSLIYAKTVMTISDSDTIYWCVIRHKISSFPRKRESTEGGFGRRLTSETASVFDRHHQAVEPPSWSIISPPFILTRGGHVLTRSRECGAKYWTGFSASRTPRPRSCWIG